MDRPRPRTFSTLQLATQKFKLRSLERVIGCNINISKQNRINGEDDKDGLVFYSLHHDRDEPAFYCSEVLPLHLKSQKWAEIVWKSPEIAKSDQNCVCVKVWRRRNVQTNNHVSHSEPTHQSQPVNHGPSNLNNAMMLKLNSNIQKPDKLEKCFECPDCGNKFTDRNSYDQHIEKNLCDQMIFSWAVYFSGLSTLCQNKDAVFSDNSLIFQLNGAYFSSPDRFTISNNHEQLTPTYQRQMLSTSTPTSSFQGSSMQASRSSSPAPSLTQTNAQANPKGRVTQIYFARNTVRYSYDLSNLLRIQEKIRVRLQKIRECGDMVDDVKRLSVRCVTANELQRRKRNTSASYSSLSYHQLQSHSMGRKLSILLSEAQHIEPASLLRAQKLQKQLEAIRCKHELLMSEQAAFRSRNTSLQIRLNALKTSREQLEKSLETNVNQLIMGKALLADKKQEHVNLLQLRQHVAVHMEQRMTSLCLELQEIYPLKRNSHGFYTVSGIPFPSFEAYANHTLGQNSNNISSEQISPLALSTSLGYIAHLTQMISVILDQPLRNPIVHEGSRSRIQDVIKEEPYGSRDFPLYSRSLMPSKLVKYAIFLLNQNIAQLCFEITGVNCDLRDTIENLLRIFSTFSKIDQHIYERTRRFASQTHPSNRVNVNMGANNDTITKDRCEGFFKTRSSIDVCDLNAAISNSSVAVSNPTADNRSRIRCSHLMGSYSDSEIDNYKNVKHTCFYSDSNIKFSRRRPN